GDPLVLDLRRAGDRLRDRCQGDVVAAGRFAVAVLTVEVGDVVLLPVRRDRAPRLPLCARTDLRRRGDVDGRAPGRAAVGRVGVEDVVVARRRRSRGGAGRLAVRLEVATVRPRRV